MDFSLTRFLRSGEFGATALRTGLRALGLLILFGSAVAADNPPSNNSVATIVVQGQKLDVETRIDRKIYTVPEDALSSVGTLSDILNVIPSVDVDPDGVLSLRGDTNVLILIDGKPATQLQGSKAGDNLQSISAREIERIEVLTTPPAQYKAEGTAGVINIITRRHGTQERMSGSLQGSVGDGGRRLLGANANYSTRGLSLSANAGYRQDYRHRIIRSDVTGPDPATGGVLDSRDFATQHLRRNVPTADVAAEYDPNDRQSISWSGSWLRRGGLRTYTQFDNSILGSGGLASSTRRLTSGHDPEDDYNTVLRFSQKLSRPGETLDISLHRSISHQHEHYDYTNDSFVPPGPTFFNNLSFTEDHGISEAGLDYALPLTPSQSLKLGYAFEQEDYGFNNVGANVDPVTHVETVDPTLTNHFLFRQRTHAIYGSYQGTYGAWTLLAGLRTEWTSTDALQVTSHLAKETHYADLFPSLHVDRVLSDRSTLSFGASRRVTRPNPSFLNPYVDREYPPNLNSGNPNLKPQFTQSYEIGYGYEGRGAAYALTGYYRRNQNGVTDVTEYLGDGLSLTTKTNLPRSNSAGVEFSATGHLTSTLSYNVSGNGFYHQIDTTAIGVPGLRSTTGVNLKAKLDFRPTARDSAQVTFTRTDRKLTPQGSLSAINQVNLGYKRSLSSSLSVSATVTDLFNGQRYRRVADTSRFTQIYERNNEGRVIFIGLTWNFGVVTKTQKSSNFDYESEN